MPSNSTTSRTRAVGAELDHADFDDPIDILAHLMIGSEGTLGFIASITYATVEDHADKASAFIVFPSLVAACAAVTALKATPVDAVELLDVREADERDDGHIPGSRHLPYRTARAAAEAGLLDGRPVVTICESGPRAAIAASVLQAAGVDARPVLEGGTATWRGEISSFRRCGS